MTSDEVPAVPGPSSDLVMCLALLGISPAAAAKTPDVHPGQNCGWATHADRGACSLKISSALEGDTPRVDREVVHQELEDAREAFHHLVAAATETDLRCRTNGTRWTNKQLLFHMLLGYLILRALSVLVRLFGRLPDGVSRTYTRILNSATTPFDAVNHLGSRLGGTGPSKTPPRPAPTKPSTRHSTR